MTKITSKYILKQVCFKVTMTTSALILSACQSLTPPERGDLVGVPDAWSDLQKSNPSSHDTNPQSTQPSNVEAITPKALRWSSLTDNAIFRDLTLLALNNNPTLQQQKLAIDIAYAELRSSNISLYVPELSMGLGVDHGEAGLSSGGSSTYSLSSDLNYELNIWGQLSDAKRASTYRYAAQRATYEQARQDLMFALSNAWFDLLSAHELIDLFERRLINQQENLN